MRTNNAFSLLPIAAAMFAFGNARAQDSAEIQALITPSSSVSAGVGFVNNSDDARRFGEYSGMSKDGAYGLFDLNLIKRDESTGTWLILQGRDLGLDTRELSFTHQKQGDWKYSLEYNEMVRRDPYTIHSGITGVGTENPTINLINKPAMPAAWATANGLKADNGVAGSDMELKIKRTIMGITAEKWLTPEWQFEGSARTEEKKGARLFGRAGLDSGDMGSRPTNNVANANGNWAILLTPEPIHSTTNIIEGKVSFNRDKLALTGGYYGSFYVNDFGSLSPSVPGTLNRGALWSGNSPPASSVAQLASAPVALPPDNQAHQLYMSGTYAYSPATRMNFKASYTHATQNDSFTSQGLTPAVGAPSNLGGEVNTTLAQMGLTSRVNKELTINASLRYENRDDNTPRNIYNTAGIAAAGSAASALNNTTNWPSASQTRTTAKLEGIYRLPDGYSAVLGTDWERKTVPLPVAYSSIVQNQVFFRETLDEYGVRGELRKALSETLNGSVGLEYKQRRGDNGDWKTTSGTVGNALISVNPAVQNSVLQDTFMDRDRTRGRATLDWTPIDRVDLQMVYEHAQDNFKRQSPDVVGAAATPITAGAREMFIDSLTLDSSFTLSENWKLSAYWTMSQYRWNVNKVGIGDDTRDKSQTFGLGVKGKVTGRVNVGADLMTTWDHTTYTNNCAPPSGTCVNGNIAGFTATTPGNFLPDIHYDTTVVKLFANYAVDKASDVRLDVIYQHFKTNDWAWGYNGVPFLYSDNTTVSQPTSQNLAFVGARYIYRF